MRTPLLRLAAAATLHVAVVVVLHRFLHVWHRFLGQRSPVKDCQ